MNNQNAEKKISKTGIIAIIICVALFLCSLCCAIYCAFAAQAGTDGTAGKSAYELAVENGYQGTEDEWLSSLIGDKGDTGDTGATGAAGSDGKSAYELAVENGYQGTLTEWLASLVGEAGAAGTDGTDGKSAYELAVENGFEGSLEEWLVSLVGEKGDKGDKGDTGATGAAGADGTDGKSAYELAVENGYQGTLTEWLASLVGEAGAAGADGSDGKSAYELAVENGFEGSLEEWLVSLVGEKGDKGDKGDKGENGQDGKDGATWLTGTVAPNDSQGQDGDFYFDSITYDIYNKVNGGWQQIANIGSVQDDSETTERYELTLTSLGDYGELSGGGNYVNGEEVTIIAKAYPVYEFVGWYSDGALITPNAEYSFTMPAEDTNYEARYTVREDLAPFSFIAGEDYCIITGVTDTSVTELVVPDCVTDIKLMAFFNCRSLTSLTLPIADRAIGYYFSNHDPTSTYYQTNMPPLKTLILSEGLTYIAPDAFTYLKQLTDLYLPSTLTRIGDDAFTGCSALKNIHISDLASFCTIYNEGASLLGSNRNLYLNGTLVTDLVIPNGVISLGNAFAYYSKLTSVVMPDSLVNIGYAAFDGCAYLRDVDFGGNLFAIGALAFRNCTRLNNVDIPKTVKSIGERAFYNCDSLINIVIPDGVTSIALWTFDGSGLKTIVIPRSVSHIGDYVFNATNNMSRIYYGGSEADWEQVNIESANNLSSVTIYHYSDTQPTESGNYWHYDTDGVTPVIW